jgi:hypothetical protein
LTFAAVERLSAAEAEDVLLAEAFDAHCADTAARCPAAAAREFDQAATANADTDAVVADTTANATVIAAVKSDATDADPLLRFVAYAVGPMLLHLPQDFSGGLKLPFARARSAQSVAAAAVAAVAASAGAAGAILTAQPSASKEASASSETATFAWFAPLAAAVRARRRALRRWQRWGLLQRLRREAAVAARLCRLRACFGALALFAAAHGASWAGFAPPLPPETDARRADAAEDPAPLLLAAFPHSVGAHLIVGAARGDHQGRCQCCLLGSTATARDASAAVVAVAGSSSLSSFAAANFVAALQRAYNEKLQRSWLRAALVRHRSQV